MFNRRCFSRFPRVINSFPTEEDQKSEQTERQTSPVIELACQGTFVTGTAPTPGLGNRQGSTVTTKKFTIGSSDPATWVGGSLLALHLLELDPDLELHHSGNLLPPWPHLDLNPLPLDLNLHPLGHIIPP